MRFGLVFHIVIAYVCYNNSQLGFDLIHLIYYAHVISFVQLSHYIPFQGGTKIVQQHRLTGHCSTLAFQVEFELTDVKVNILLYYNV